MRILFRWEDQDILMVEQRLQQTKILINCYASIAEISQTTSELWNNPDATFQMNIGSNDYNQMISKAKANQPFDDNYKLLNNTTGLHCINKGNNNLC